MSPLDVAIGAWISLQFRKSGTWFFRELQPPSGTRGISIWRGSIVAASNLLWFVQNRLIQQDDYGANC